MPKLRMIELIHKPYIMYRLYSVILMIIYFYKYCSDMDEFFSVYGLTDEKNFRDFSNFQIFVLDFFLNLNRSPIFLKTAGYGSPGYLDLRDIPASNNPSLCRTRI